MSKVNIQDLTLEEIEKARIQAINKATNKVKIKGYKLATIANPRNGRRRL